MCGCGRFAMKTVHVGEPSHVCVTQTQRPSPSEGEILVRMEACGICGSDLEKVFGVYGQPSMRLGHEPAGVITGVGSAVTEFKTGDRVFTHHHVPCYSCRLCQHGCETMCPQYYDTNLQPCGLSEEYVVPTWNVSHGGVLKLPDSMSLENATMIEPLACCIRAWTKFESFASDTAAVFGMGATGMMHTMLAQQKGFSKVLCFDVNRFRLDFAQRLMHTQSIDSADEDRHQKILDHTDGTGVDVAIVATSSIGALGDAIKSVRKGGTVVMFGVPSRGATMELDMGMIYSREIMLTTSYAASDHDTKAALDLIASTKPGFDVGQLITHRYALADSQEAFEHARVGTNAVKIIITN